MAAEIQIQGPLKFIGYEQDNKAGTNGQFLGYINGIATWRDVGEVENAITAPSSRDVVIDKNGNIVESELTTYLGIDTKPKATNAIASIQGRLEVNVINNSGAALQQYFAYSLEDNAYTLSDNTVRLTATRTGIPTQGQTALFFLQDAIPNGASGIGIIKGLITTTVLTSVDQERDLKVLPSGSLSDIILAGEYVVGTVTRSPLLDSPLEIAFNGLSNYKLVTGVGGTNYEMPFTISTWGSPVGGEYTITVLRSVHNQGAGAIPAIYDNSGIYTLLCTEKDTSGNFMFKVKSDPDRRFTGSLVIG